MSDFVRLRHNVAVRGWIGFAGVLVVAAVVGSQGLPEAQQTPSPRIARLPDGKPNLNGIWQSLNSANYNLEDHEAYAGQVTASGATGAAPAGYGFVEGGEIPYKPEALAKRKSNFEQRLKLDPETKCYLPGVPRAMYMPLPFQIV